MNRLAGARSPYLRQHADNPVHWQPWDDEALRAARAQDKPILLSVGYASCHWCHVMEKESFSDSETAAQMNADFVNIKVDREERPDLDRIYQAAHYLFTRRSGGWPLTMFLTPAGDPFFGGTYFPEVARHGLPSFRHVLERVTTAWRENRRGIDEQNAEVLPILRGLDEHDSADSLPPSAVVDGGANALESLIDRTHGGLGGAPKFPHAVELDFLLAQARRRHDAARADSVLDSLEKMSRSGLVDHLAGGCFRYCVDERWTIPHFEKMLCDNGLLLALFADARRPALQPVIDGIVSWVSTEQRADNGCFYSSLDADSEGGEGAFYLWHREDIRLLLSDDEYAAVSQYFALTDAPNAPPLWHLVRRPEAVPAPPSLQPAVEKLLAHRQKRPRPATDDKILTAWNALMIRGLARAGRQCARADWTREALESFTAVVSLMRREGRTHAVRCGDDLGPVGFLDDCAFLLDAAIELLQSEFSLELWRTAESLAVELRDCFEDGERGGFFFTPHDGEALIRRVKTFEDNSLPSGNGVACRALLRLSWLSGEPAWERLAERALCAFAGPLRQQPTAAASLLAALQECLEPPTLIFLCGDANLCREWRQRLMADNNPDWLIFILPADTDGLPAALRKPCPTEGARAYLCDGHRCAPPVNTLVDLMAGLDR